MFERYGFGADDWDAIRKTPLEEDGGAQWILPKNIDRPELVTRLSEMILQETDFAVPTSSLRIRSAINARFHKGSIPGEVGRSLLQFRGFPLQLFWMHGRRALQDGGRGAMQYAANLFIASSLMGALSYQLKIDHRGQRPCRYDQPCNSGGRPRSKAAGSASWATSSIRPSAGQGRISGRRSLVRPQERIDDARQLIQSKNKGKALRQAVQSNLPGSTLWYARLAFSREVLDQMQKQIDPTYLRELHPNGEAGAGGRHEILVATGQTGS
jgi:hypothetical protein